MPQFLSINHHRGQYGRYILVDGTPSEPKETVKRPHQLPIFRPCTHRHGQNPLRNINKTRIFNKLLKFGPWFRFSMDSIHTSYDLIGPSIRSTPGFVFASNGSELHIKVLKFDVTAGLCKSLLGSYQLKKWKMGREDSQNLLVSLPHEVWPIFYRAGEVPAVNVVEFGRVYPRRFHVVDFEPYIWWDAIYS
jgi:hypothetical protein